MRNGGRAFLTLVVFLALGSTRAGAETYPMEAGNPQRWNQALSPSTLQLPFITHWMNTGIAQQDVQGGPLVLPTQVLINRAGYLESVNRSTGATQWSDQYLDFPETPTYDPDRNLIYGCDTLGRTSCLSPSGQVLWTYAEANTLTYTVMASAAPLYANNLIYTPACGNGLVCLNPDTRAVLWRATCAAGYTLKSVALDNGRLYVPTIEGEVFCLDAATGAEIWSLDTGNEQNTTILCQGDYFYRNCIWGLVECRNKADGSLLWSYQCESYGSSDLAISGNLLIVSNDDRYVRALNSATGQLIWSRAFTGNFARCAPIIVCNQVFVSGCASQFYGLNAQNGNTAWTYNYSGANAFTDWALADGHLFVSDATGHLYDFTSVSPGDPGNCLPLQAATLTETRTHSPTASPTATRTPTRSATPTVSATYSPTATVTRTFTASPSPSDTGTPTDTASATGTASPSATPSVTPIPTRTPSANPTFSDTPSATPSPSATLTATSTATAGPSRTPSPTPRPTPVATSTATPGSKLDASPTPAGCAASIEAVSVVPDPVRICSSLKRGVDVELGPCGADKLQVCVYTVAMAEVGSFNDGPQGGGWHEVDFPGSLGLAPGLYYMTVTATKGASQCRATGVFYVLP